jgi:prophage regulatory protein
MEAHQLPTFSMKSHLPISGPRVYRIPQVVAKTGKSRASVYEALDRNGPRYDPSFPRPFALSARSRGFLADEIDAWIAAKAQNRL